MIKLYPSAELHLLRGQSVELELFMNHLGSNAWIRVNNPLALAPGVALATLSGRLLTASASAMGVDLLERLQADRFRRVGPARAVRIDRERVACAA